MRSNDTLDFGRILRPHGTRGDVRAIPLCDGLDHFHELMDSGRVLVRLDPESPRRAPVARKHAATAGPMLPEPTGARPPEAKPRPIQPVSHRTHGTEILLHFQGYDDLPTADMLRGALLCIHESDLPEPLEEEFYWHELAGLELRDKAGESVGRVARVEDNPAHALLVVQPVGDTPEFRIPFADAFVGEVDLEAGTIEVDLPPGFAESQR